MSAVCDFLINISTTTLHISACAWGWQPHHLHVPNVMKILEPKTSGTLCWAYYGTALPLPSISGGCFLQPHPEEAPCCGDRELLISKSRRTYKVSNEPHLPSNQTSFHFSNTINHLTPNDPYMGRNAQLTSRCCILYIYLTNIHTEYFKHAA